MEDDERNEKSGFLEAGDFGSRLPIKIGPYFDGHNGFFIAFAKGLSKLRIDVTVEELRQKCKEFAENNPPPWFRRDLMYIDYFETVATDEDIDSYISCINEDREGEPNIEGRILCQIYDVHLYMIYSYFSTYYVMNVVDDNGTRYSNNIDFDYSNNIYIADTDGVYYQTVTIDKDEDYDYESEESDDHDSEESESVTSDKYEDYDYESEESDDHDSEESESFDHDLNSPTSTHALSRNARKQIICKQLVQLSNVILKGNVYQVKKIDKILHDSGVSDETLLTEVYYEGMCPKKNDYIVAACLNYKQGYYVLKYLLHETCLLHYFPSDIDREEEEKDRRVAFHFAMCSNDFNLVDLLYNYWAGTMPRWSGSQNDEKEVISNLNTLSRILNETRGKIDFIFNQQMLDDVQCLIAFNNYQLDLYNKLNDLRSKFNYSDTSVAAEAERVRTLIVNILHIHKNHSDINYIRLKKICPDEEQSIQDLLQDESSTLTRALLFMTCEVYYRKLDFHVTLLLLEYLHLLKQRLKTPEQTYPKIEAALYHYVYRVSDDWRLYFPNNREILTVDMIGMCKGVFACFKAIHDSQRVLNGLVIFFERQHFQKCLYEFRDVLESINVINNIRQLNEKLPNDEINSLTWLPHLRDDYSLKRIKHYMEALMSIDIDQDKENGILIIERVIQVIGEMFKTTEESFHLSPTTKALLQTTVSVETLADLEGIRLALSHAEEGQLNRKIQIERTEIDILRKVKVDLENIIHRINTVLEIYKPILDKSLVKIGIVLLYSRIRDMPEKATFFKEIIKVIYFSCNLYNEQIFSMLENSFIEEKWSELRFTKQLLREIGLIQVNIHQLNTKKLLIKKRTICIILGSLPKKIEIIKQKLKFIEDNNTTWNFILKSASKIVPDLSEQPTDEGIQRVKNKLQSLIKKSQQIDDDLMENIKNVKNYNQHWEYIKEVLRFLLVEVKIFKYNPLEIKRRRYSAHFAFYIDDQPANSDAIKAVYEFIEMIMFEVSVLVKRYAPDTTQQTFKSDEFLGIKKLLQLLNETQTDSNQNSAEYVKNKRTQLHMNLIDRIELLKQLFDYPKEIPITQHLLRYNYDQKFRIITEMLLGDIMNVFVACNIKSLFIKSSNILTGINLRNVLAHGNPFLEVVGDALDSRDLPVELLRWATRIIGDSNSITALCSLYSENINYEMIENDSKELMTPDQQKQLDIFKNCNNWEDYLKLIPKTWHERLQQSPEPVIEDELFNKFLDAAIIKNMELLKICINDVDSDKVDRHGKSALHYAAMKGHVEIIKELARNGANMNVADAKTGKTPLHYAVQNNHAAAVIVLLNHGADTTIEDNQKRIPLCYIKREKDKNDQIAMTLARDMTVRMGFYLCAFCNTR